MLADENRLKGYRNLISKFCPGKKVVDFGAGSGILGILAFCSGATEVWFVEQEASMIFNIKENCKLNGLTEFQIVKSIEELPSNYFDVCLSETLGDLALEESLIEYNQLILNNPSAIAIPDQLIFKYEPVSINHFTKLEDNIQNTGIKLISGFTKFEIPIKTMLYGVLIDSSKEIYKIDLRAQLPTAIKVSIQAPKVKSTGNLLWWEATTDNQYVTSNSPHLKDTKFNHWKQLLIPPYVDHDIFFDFTKRTICLKYSGSEKLYDLSINN